MTSIQSRSEDPSVNDMSVAVVTASPPMAVLPLNSSSKLDQEPNPFEQSFSGAAHEPKTSPTSSTPVSTSCPPQKDTRPILPSVASLASPAVMGALPKDVANQFLWDSLHSGPLSPSMLAGPAKRAQYDYTMVNGDNDTQHTQQPSTTNLPSTQHQHSPPLHQQAGFTAAYKRKMSDNERDSALTHIGPESVSSMDDSDAYDHLPQQTTKSTKKSQQKVPEDDEKRRNFLERNRIAALKCRQRKKQWLNNLQMRAEVLSTENEQLQVQVETMSEEIMNLKTLLLAHKDCPVTQNNSFNGATAATAAVPKTLAIMPQQVIRSGSVAVNQPNYTQSYADPDRSQPANASASMATSPFHHPAILGMRMQPQSHSAAHQSMLAGAVSSTSILRF